MYSYLWVLMDAYDTRWNVGNKMIYLGDLFMC